MNMSDELKLMNLKLPSNDISNGQIEPRDIKLVLVSLEMLMKKLRESRTKRRCKLSSLLWQKF
jgi:hypothetical protein